VGYEPQWLAFEGLVSAGCAMQVVLRQASQQLLLAQAYAAVGGLAVFPDPAPCQSWQCHLLCKLLLL
jgi:hypothetical protein